MRSMFGEFQGTPPVSIFPHSIDKGIMGPKSMFLNPIAIENTKQIIPASAPKHAHKTKKIRKPKIIKTAQKHVFCRTRAPPRVWARKTGAFALVDVEFGATATHFVNIFDFCKIFERGATGIPRHLLLSVRIFRGHRT